MMLPRILIRHGLILLPLSEKSSTSTKNLNLVATEQIVRQHHSPVSTAKDDDIFNFYVELQKIFELRNEWKIDDETFKTNLFQEYLEK